MALAKHNDAPANFNRRSLLIAAPAAGVALVAGQAGAESPVNALFREWMRLDAEEREICRFDDLVDNDPRLDDVMERKGEIEREMIERSETLAEIALSIAAASDFGGYGIPDEAQRKLKVAAHALIG